MGGKLGCLKIPRGDRNGVGEDQVTLTSGFQEQAERTKQKQGKRVLHPVEAQTKVRSRVMLLNHGGARLVAEGGLCRVKGGLPKT